MRVLRKSNKKYQKVRGKETVGKTAGLRRTYKPSISERNNKPVNDRLKGELSKSI